MVGNGEYLGEFPIHFKFFYICTILFSEISDTSTEKEIIWVLEMYEDKRDRLKLKLLFLIQ